MEKREHLGSRLGFILLSAGCAIGLGNVWKFPYMAGQYGGGLFVIIYLAMLVLFGIPVMTMEFTIGRAAQKSPIKSYQELEPKGSKWHIHGYVSLIALFLLMMYYTTVAGWLLQYFVKMIKGDFVGLDADGVAGAFGDVLANPTSMTIYMGIVVVLGFVVCGIGLKKGLENITKYMMLALLVLMIVLAVNSFTMDGAKEGLSFFLLPSVERFKEIGVAKVVLGALNQAFFTLSIGIGSMQIFGSYIDKERSLLGEAINVTVLDTFVAISAGLIMFPACFSFDVEVGAGPSLIFITLPNVFNNMAGGRLWGSLFFLFMCFAAFSTVFAVFEGIIACMSELFGWERKRTCIICGIMMFVLSLPCVFGFNIWSGFQPLGEGTGVLDLEDFFVSNLILPIGSIVYVLFCTLKNAWGWDKFIEEANAGKGLKFPKGIRVYVKYVVPIAIACILIFGLIDIFA